MFKFDKKFSCEKSVKLNKNNGYVLHFQYGIFTTNAERPIHGYRFVWTENGKEVAGGQAIIPSIADINYLVDLATREGWGDKWVDKTFTYWGENNNGGEYI